MINWKKGEDKSSICKNMQYTFKIKIKDYIDNFKKNTIGTIAHKGLPTIDVKKPSILIKYFSIV